MGQFRLWRAKERPHPLTYRLGLISTGIGPEVHQGFSASGLQACDLPSRYDFSGRRTARPTDLKGLDSSLNSNGIQAKTASRL